MRLIHIILLLLANLICSSTLSAQKTRLLSRVQLSFYDSFGVPVEDWHLTAFKDSNGRDWKRHFRNGTSNAIPFGDYVLRAESGIFLPYEGRVSVRSFQTIHLIGLTFAGVENSPPSDTVAGKFSKHPGPGTWCKLSGIYTPHTYFVAVDDRGSFEFPLVVSGSYLLLCRKETSDLILRNIEVRYGTTPLVVVAAEK